MLRNLLKYEFQATGRVMLPIFGLVLLLTVFMAVGVRFWESVSSPILNILFVLIFTAYGFAMVGMFVVLLVLMVARFRNNYLRDEGYIMFTLPVNAHHLVWSKAICASVWFMATLVVVCLSGLIIGFVVSLGTGFLPQLLEWLSGIWSELTAYYALNGIALLLEGILVCFVGYISFCLMAYASLALGHSRDRHKMLLSVLLFFVFYTALQILTMTVMYTGDVDGAMTAFDRLQGMEAMHLVMLITFAIEAITGAAFYFATIFGLQKRLNLE